jgi:nucleotide-binding universal stress UspA family protein
MRVLMATDGSSDARQAVEWLRSAPLPTNTGICVVSAMPVPVVYEAFVAAWAELRKQTDEVVDEARWRLGERWPNVTARIVEGEPRQAILDAAVHEAADLVVLGARGLGAVASFLMGSVSLGVARHAPCPVLVCKGTPRAVRSVTVAVDGSEHARAALRFVCGLPLPAGTLLHLVSVIEPLRYPSTAPSVIAPQLVAALRDYEEERRRELEQVLAAAAAEAPSAVTTSTTTLVGAPALSILAEADKRGTDLVVVGARGLGAVKRLLLGSVSESVLRHAACPVLVVRPRAADGG